MFTKHLRNDAHTRRYSIASTESGWEVREEQDSLIVRCVEYHDWHRVEHARRTIAIEVDQLQAEGWRLE